MLECLILGDSIGVGLGMVRHGCETHAKVGINSRDWNRAWLHRGLDADRVIISLGSNDWDPRITREELIRLRDEVRSAHVTWIIPAIKPQTRAVVMELAMQHGDAMVDLRSVSLGPDGVHPTSRGYHDIDGMIR